MSHAADHDRDDTPTAPAARRCLSACALADHRHAEQLRQRSNNNSALNPRHTRIRRASKREEAASRDLAQELRA